MRRALALIILTAIAAPAAEPKITTVVGTGSGEPNVTQTPLTTNVGQPFGVEVGPDGEIYICEVQNHRLWRWSPDTDQLVVIAGTGEAGYAGDGGPATQARLNEPYEVRLDDSGNLYFVEMQNHLVRKLDRRTGILTTVAGSGVAGFSGDGGPAVQARLRRPHSIALDLAARALFIADIGNHRIRRVDLDSGIIETFAGDGQKRLPTAGQSVAGTPVLGPRALYITDHTLWVALREGHSVWRIDLRKPIWQHVAGSGEQGYHGDGGPATMATLNGPKGIVVDGEANIFVVDTENQVIRQIDGRTRLISTLAGSGPDHRGYGGDDGPATQARLDRPHGICVNASSEVFIGDTGNHRVRKITLP